MLHINSFLESQISSLFVLYAYCPAQCLTHRRHLFTEWTNFWGLSLNIQNFPSPSRTSLKGLPSCLSFSSLGFAPPHEMLVCPAYTCMLGEGGESHCCQVIECPGRGRGWWTGGRQPGAGHTLSRLAGQSLKSEATARQEAGKEPGKQDR